MKSQFQNSFSGALPQWWQEFGRCEAVCRFHAGFCAWVCRRHARLWNSFWSTVIITNCSSRIAPWPSTIAFRSIFLRVHFILHVHFIIVMIRCTVLASREFEFLFVVTLRAHSHAASVARPLARYNETACAPLGMAQGYALGSYLSRCIDSMQTSRAPFRARITNNFDDKIIKMSTIKSSKMSMIKSSKMSMIKNDQKFR